MIDLTKYKSNDSFLYMMLDRLRLDCNYYLDNGKQTDKLWAQDEQAQIDLMLKIWNNFEENEKPEWINLADIQELEKKLIKY